MPKQTHFRIIELHKLQVLLTKDVTDEIDQTPAVIVSFFLPNKKIEEKLAYVSEKVRDRVFEEFSHDQAELVVETMTEMFCHKIITQ